jgi:hypothetical protein
MVVAEQKSSCSAVGGSMVEAGFIDAFSFCHQFAVSRKSGQRRANGHFYRVDFSTPF